MAEEGLKRPASMGQPQSEWAKETDREKKKTQETHKLV
jgi:hypothetical protein